MIYPRIKELRESKGFTQQQAAIALNLPVSTYRSYETGAREPSVETLILLSEMYNVTVDYILSHTIKPLVTIEEAKQVQKYRELDDFGKETVSAVLDIEYRRCTADAKPQQATIKSFRAASSIDNHPPEITEMEDLAKYPEADMDDI